MPMIKLSDLNGQSVKPGDKIEFTVSSVDGENVNLSYDNAEVESEMSMDEMNDPMKVKEMDTMSSDEMKKRLPKKMY